MQTAVITKKSMGFFKDARITLVNPSIEQLYSSMIPGLISKLGFDESYRFNKVNAMHCRFFKDTLLAIEPDKTLYYVRKEDT